MTNAASGSGSVFAVTYNSGTGATMLYGVSTSSGAITLDVTLPSAGSNALDPNVDQGRVFVTLWLPGTVFPPWRSVEVIAVDASTGATDWTAGGQASSVSAVGTAVGSGYVVFAYNCCARPGLPQGLPATDVVHESDGTHVSSTDYELLDVVQNSLAYGQISDPNTLQTGTGAVAPATGTVKWSHGVTSAFAVSGTSAVFLSSGVGVEAFDAKTGAAQ